MTVTFLCYDIQSIFVRLYILEMIFFFFLLFSIFFFDVFFWIIHILNLESFYSFNLFALSEYPIIEIDSLC